MTIIEVQTLSLERGGRTVLHDMSFCVERGDVLAIIGPSGGGKSSLLRCLNRLEEPPPDSVLLNGTDITTLPVTELRQRVGMIFQKTAAFPGTVADNLAYGPSLRGETLSRERVRQLLELASLEPDLADREASELSGGQEQRLAIARALANEPDVLLLDEPTSSLDPIATHHVEESLDCLKNQLGMTMIWVSHSVEQARRLADRVLLLDSGRVLRVDGVEAMLDPATGDSRALAFAEGDETGFEGG